MSDASPRGKGVSSAVETSAATVARGGFWNMASNVIPQLYVIVVSIAAARFLGASGFGRQSYIAFIEIAVITLLTAGVPGAVVRFVGRAVGRKSPDEVLSLVRWAWRLESIGALVGACALVIAAAAGATPRAAWLFAAVVVAAQVLTRVPNSFLNGIQRWREPSVIALAVGFLATVSTLVVLIAGGGISGMFAVESAAAVTMLICLAAMARRLRPAGVATRLTNDERSAVTRFALLTSAGVILTLIVYRRSEFLFLNHYSSDAQIALYSVAFSAVAALLLFPQALVGVALPAVATLWGENAFNRIRAGYGRGLRLLPLISFPLTAAAMALGPETLRLVYGPEFSSVGAVLLIVLASLPLYSIISLSSVVLAGIGRLAFPLIVGVIAAAVNIGLDFALIPAYDAVGAAIANSVAQLVVGLPVLAYAHRLVGPTDVRLGPVVRVAVAAVAGGLLAWVTLRGVGGAAGVCAGLVVGTLAFMLLGGVLRVLSAEDAGWLEQVGGVRLAPAMRGLARWWAPRQST